MMYDIVVVGIHDIISFQLRSGTVPTSVFPDVCKTSVNRLFLARYAPFSTASSLNIWWDRGLVPMYNISCQKQKKNRACCIFLRFTSQQIFLRHNMSSIPTTKKEDGGVLCLCLQFSVMPALSSVSSLGAAALDDQQKRFEYHLHNWGFLIQLYCIISWIESVRLVRTGRLKGFHVQYSVKITY